MTELKKILYVEDDPDIQIIVKHSLESISNFKLTICSSGAEALKLIDTINPDLLLSDVMMPNMDGLTLLNEIKKLDKFKNLPHIFITAKGNTSNYTTLMSSGGLGLLFKPFNPMSIGTEIQSMWDTYQASIELTEAH